MPVSVTGSIARHFEQVTIDAAAGGVGLTAATYSTHKKAHITVETAQIRYRANGEAPTSATGHLLNPGNILDLDSNEDIVNFKAIRTNATSGLISVTYSD